MTESDEDDPDDVYPKESLSSKKMKRKDTKWKYSKGKEKKESIENKLLLKQEKPKLVDLLSALHDESKILEKAWIPKYNSITLFVLWFLISTNNKRLILEYCARKKRQI